MQYDDHLPVTRLEDGVFDVVVENVHFIAADRREAETCAGRRSVTFRHCWKFLRFERTLIGSLTISMRLQRALHPLLSDVGSDVEVFELRVAAVEVDDQRVLLDDALLLLLLGFSRLVALLHLLDDAEGVLQVGGRHRRVAGSLEVGRPVCAERGEREARSGMFSVG